MTVKVRVQFDAKGNFRVLDDFDNKIKKSTTSAKMFGNALSTLGGFVGAQAIIGGFNAIASAATGAFSKVVSSAAQLEQTKTQFATLTGSVQSATKVINDLQNFTATTPFQFDGVAQASQRLLSFGFTTQEIVPLLRELGDVSAGSGTDLSELALIFGQVQAAGKLTGERLLQLQERAIPIGPALAQTLGVAESAVRDLVSNGKVSFEDFRRAFETLNDSGGMFFESTIKQSQTLNGVFSTLSDNVDISFAKMGEAILPIAKLIGVELVKVFQDVTKIIDQNQDALRDLAQKGFFQLADALVVTLNHLDGFARLAVAVFRTIKTGANAMATVFVESLRRIIGAARSLGSLVGLESVKLETAYNTLAIASKNLADDTKRDFKTIGDSFKIESSNIQKAARFIETSNKRIQKSIKDTKKVSDQVSIAKSGIARGPDSVAATAQRNLEGTTKQVTSGFDVNKTMQLAFQGLASPLRGAQGASDLVAGAANLLLPGIGPIVSELAKGPEHVEKMVQEFAKALPVILTNIVKAVPVFVRELIKAIPDIIDGLLKELPALIEGLIDAIPMLIDALVDAIPRLIETLAENMGPVAIAFAQAMVTMSPTIAISLAKAMAIEVPKAVVGGLAPGIGGLGDKVGFSGDIFSMKIGDSAENFFGKIGEAGEKFLGDLVDGLKQVFEAIFESFKGILGGGGGFGGVLPQLGETLTKIPIIGSLVKGIGGDLGIGGIFDDVFGSVGGVFGGALGGIGKIFGFSEGGDIPPGFQNDTFGPAFLSSGESVITASTTEKVNDFIDNRLPMLENGIAMLANVVAQPMQVQSSVEVNQEAFANIILNLNRSNARLA